MEVIIKYRGKGKTHDAVRYAILNDCALLVPTEQSKRYAKMIACDMGYKDLIVLTPSDNMNGIKKPFVIDELNLLLERILGHKIELCTVSIGE
jgi:hypothetical protein